MFSFEGTDEKKHLPKGEKCDIISLLLIKFPVMMRLWDTPVPIPNTMVKTQAAEDTWWEAAWENRWSPESILGV